MTIGVGFLVVGLADSLAADGLLTGGNLAAGFLARTEFTVSLDFGVSTISSL